MNYVILGFLFFRSLNQYELHTILKTKVSPFYQPSLGSIQSSLKKMLELQWITLERIVEKGKKKNIYTLSALGRESFLAWMLLPSMESKMDTEVSTRLFFLGLVGMPERVAIVDQIIFQFESIIESFEKADEENKGRVFSDDLAEIAGYQLKTLHLGLYQYQMTLSWFKILQKELEAQGCTL